MKEKGLTGSTLKWIAIVTMFADHIGAAVVEKMLLSGKYGEVAESNPLYLTDLLLRGIGRLAFPIFCFLLVEGFLHTGNVWKYAGRLAAFAVISEIPFDLAFQGEWMYPGYQNIFFTLLIGLLVMMAFRAAEERIPSKLWRTVCQALFFVAGFALADALHTDYGGTGVLCIMLLYIFRYNKKLQILAGAAAFTWEITAPFAFIPIYFYNGKRGMRMKYFFYAFYPLHLLVLYAAACILGVS